MVNIRLDKKTKTIKIVNRKDNIRLTHPRGDVKLQHTGKIGPQGIQGVQGDKGDKGTSINWRGEWSPTESYVSDLDTVDAVSYNGSSYIAVSNSTNEVPAGNLANWHLLSEKGDTGISTFVRVHHGSDNSVSRPSSVYVEWVGSVPPLNATEEDTWVRTP